LKDEKKRNDLRDNHNCRAIEMESSGVADGTWSCNKSYFVVREIVDYCNTKKDDKWHNYAALCAAAYAKSLIELF
jgi:nucleoside phosphorylase